MDDEIEIVEAAGAIVAAPELRVRHPARLVMGDEVCRPAARLVEAVRGFGWSAVVTSARGGEPEVLAQAVRLWERLEDGRAGRYGFAIWTFEGRTGRGAESWAFDCCWIIESERFVKLGAAAIVAYLQGPEALAERAAAKAASVERAAGTRRATAALRARVQRLIVEDEVPARLVPGGLVGDHAKIEKMVAGFEGRTRDGAGG